ncbi:MAG: hypothetical protein JXO22_17590 [Phycisphaerae bacterium]|nr:hypothetical protein [Phycisphaerae bacterium]
MSEWQKVGIELPPNWKEAVAERARELGCPMRYLWMAAIDRLLTLPQAELEQTALAFELMARKDFDKLGKTAPGRCQDLIMKWAADFVAALGPQPARRGHGGSSKKSS